MNRRRFAVELLEDRLAPANLTMTNLRNVDANNSLEPNPVYGQMLYLRADWSSTAMVGGEACTVRYTVNGIPADSGTVTHSAGNGGWNWYRGGWYIGTAAISVTATVDPDNLIAETNEADNSTTITVTPIAPTNLPSKFLQPIGRGANADWGINNYADVDPRSGSAQDARGGGYEYDGHDAIDAGPWGNDGMDAGFPIYAAAAGTISAFVDGNFDRQTAATGAAGNYVQITHGNGWQTLYYHFAKDTITVKVGDVVKAGQVIGLMGSSGNSTGTHLHYTAFYRGCQVEAAFSPSTYWLNPLPYAGDVPAFALDAFVTNLNPSSDISERYSRVGQFSTTQGGTLYFPAIIYNLRTPAVTSIPTWRWYNPSGVLTYTSTFTPGSDYRFSWWYYTRPLSQFTASPGTWQFAFELNGIEVKRVPFVISTTTGEAALRVTTGGAIVSDERTTPYTFTSTAVGGTAPTQTFTLNNHGGATLNLSGWSAPTGFSFVGSPPTTLAVGASTSVILQMNTTAVGAQFGRVLFNTNDPDHPEFTFTVEGTVTGTVPVGSPVITLPDPALGYNFKSLPRVIAPNATFSDSDSTAFTGLYAEIAAGGDGFDVLAVRNQGTAAGQVGVSGFNVTYGGTLIGTLQAVAAPNVVSIAFNASATVAAVQAVLRNITYANSKTTPFYNRRAVRFAVQDSTLNISNLAIETVTPSGVERAPTVTALSNAATTTGYAITRAGSFSDPYGNTWAGTVNYGDGSGALPLTLNPDKSFSITKAYAASGAYTVTVTITSDTGGTKSSTFTVNVYTPPTVTGITINDDAAQRSQLTKIVVNLGTSIDAAVFANPGAVSLTRTSPSGGPTVDATNGLIISPATGSTSTLTLTFANISTTGIDKGSLTDGRWQLNLPVLGYTSPLNDVNLRRLFGDANGDGTIDGADLVLFGNTFSSNNPVFDFNYDGTVDGSDLVTFGNRFGLAN